MSTPRESGGAAGAGGGRGRALPGHRTTPLGRSPFGPAAPTVVCAVGYLVTSLVWVLAGDHLPGGRWLAVHLFTLGVLSNLILTLSEHFGRTLTRRPDGSTRWQLPVLNLGIVAVLVGVSVGVRAWTSVGATVVTVVVFVAYRRLRRMRRAAVGARFTWIVRVYERTHGAFIHGAVLGLLLGIGVLPADWYGGVRLAHMHTNVLGWGGGTLLATLVFLGPTVLRTRIRPGADEVAARVLRSGMTGLTLGVVLLVVTGVGGTVGTVLRVLAALGFAAFAVATTRVCGPVVAAARAASPSAARPGVIAVGCWFPVVVWADVVAVALGRWDLLAALGLAALLAVLAQAIVTVLTYLAPMLRGASFAARDRLIARTERLAATRTVAANLAIGWLVVATAVPVVVAGWTVTAAWGVLAAVVAAGLVSVLWPVPRDAGGQVASQVARRYRDRS